MEIIYTEEKDFIDCPLEWQKRGLQQTASGYGSKLTTSRKYKYNGKYYRVYACCYSNNGTAYIIVKGKEIVLS